MDEIIAQASKDLNIPDLQEYIDQLKSDLTPIQCQEFDVAFEFALKTGHHFLKTGINVTALKYSKSLPSNQILDSCLMYDMSPQGTDYWMNIDNKLAKQHKD